MGTHEQQPNQIDKALAAMCRRNAALLRAQAAGWEAVARQADPPADPWIKVEAQELVPGDRIISGGVEADVVQTAWHDIDERLVVLDLPCVHGGTYPSRQTWPKDREVRVLADLHARLVDEIVAEDDADARSNATDLELVGGGF